MKNRALRIGTSAVLGIGVGLLCGAAVTTVLARAGVSVAIRGALGFAAYVGTTAVAIDCIEQQLNK